MCCDPDFNRAWARLPCCMSNCPLKQYFLDIYLTTFSQSVFSETQKLCLSSFFSTSSKFNLESKNAPRKSEKPFCFWDNWIWIAVVKLSLLGTGYFSSAANVLTSSPRIWHVYKRYFFQINFLGSDRWIWSRWCDKDFNSAWKRLPCCLSKVPLKRHFLDIYPITFSKPIISEIQKLWLSSFDSKCSKFNLDFRNAAKNSEQFFCFSDNWILIGILKLTLLRTGYFSSPANVFTSSPKVCHVNKRDFFEHNLLASGQWKW